MHRFLLSLFFACMAHAQVVNAIAAWMLKKPFRRQID